MRSKAVTSEQEEHNLIKRLLTWRCRRAFCETRRDFLASSAIITTEVRLETWKGRPFDVLSHPFSIHEVFLLCLRNENQFNIPANVLDIFINPKEPFRVIKTGSINIINWTHLQKFVSAVSKRRMVFIVALNSSDFGSLLSRSEKKKERNSVEWPKSNWSSMYFGSYRG